MLESGLEAGQRVIVEGIQLVKAGQTVEVEEVPLEKFQHGRIRQSLNGDPRFTSKVSRLPGVASPPPMPGRLKSSRDLNTKKAEPEVEERRPASPKRPESQADPDQRSSAPTEKKAR